MASAPSAVAAPAAALSLAVPPVAERRAKAVDRLISNALTHRGTPYRWGGSTPSGFDCSGFTSYVYASAGVRMDHSSFAQKQAFPRVERDELRRGDLVFFAGDGHVGIYMGGGRFIHSPRSGDVVKVSHMNDSWYRTGYSGAVRPPVPV